MTIKKSLITLSFVTMLVGSTLYAANSLPSYDELAHVEIRADEVLGMPKPTFDLADENPRLGAAKDEIALLQAILGLPEQRKMFESRSGTDLAKILAHKLAELPFCKRDHKLTAAEVCDLAQKTPRLESIILTDELVAAIVAAFNIPLDPAPNAVWKRVINLLRTVPVP